MLHQGVKMVATGRSAISVKKGMEWATEKVIDWVKEHAIPVRNDEDIINIGTISANGDRSIGELLCNAISKVGQDGIITIEPAKSVKTTLDVVEGMQFESGYVSPYFVTNQEKLNCELTDPYVLITNKKINSLQEILPVLELTANANRPLLIIADEIEGEDPRSAHHFGDDVLAEVVRGVLQCVGMEEFNDLFGIEKVDPHGGQDVIRIPGDGLHVLFGKQSSVCGYRNIQPALDCIARHLKKIFSSQRFSP
jgi:chaperonin GroEL (HSP60 family)